MSLATLISESFPSRSHTLAFPSRSRTLARCAHSRSGTWILRATTDESVTTSFGEGAKSSPFDFKNYIRSALQKLRQLDQDWDGEGGVAISTTAFFTIYGILTRVSDRRTVYPFLTPFDRGGVLAEWHAGVQKIEIEVDRHGDAYLFATDDNGRIILNGEATRESEKRLQQVLNGLSQRVSRENPTWRQLFQ